VTETGDGRDETGTKPVTDETVPSSQKHGIAYPDSIRTSTLGAFGLVLQHAKD